MLGWLQRGCDYVIFDAVAFVPLIQSPMGAILIGRRSGSLAWVKRVVRPTIPMVLDYDDAMFTTTIATVRDWFAFSWHRRSLSFGTRAWSSQQIHTLRSLRNVLALAS